MLLLSKKGCCVCFSGTFWRVKPDDPSFKPSSLPGMRQARFMRHYDDLDDNIDSYS
jgi:hypothetical protein